MDTNVESTLVAQLRAAAGAPAGQTRFPVERDGVRFEVYYASGSSSYVELSAQYDAARGEALTLAPAREGAYREGARHVPFEAVRPLQIRLRRETQDDGDKKADGVNREVQTGDAVFDAAVYVDSPSNDGVIALVLGPAEVRAAVRALVEMNFVVTLDDVRGRVTAWRNSFTESSPTPDAGAAVVAAFAKLMVSLPRVARAPGRRPSDAAGCLGALAGAVATVGLLAAIPAYMAMVPDHCVMRDGDPVSIQCNRIGCCEPATLGFVTAIVVGALAAIVARSVLRRSLGGRSNSSGRIAWGIAIAFCFFTALTFYAVAWVALP